MYQAVNIGKLSGNGIYTQKCQKFFEERYGFKKCLLTTSGTDALEMCALLCNLKPGDEVIIPSYTFVSTALAFIREGATIIFADSMDRNPNIDAKKIEKLITPKTKVIVPVHYAGVSCDMEAIMSIANRYNLIVVEDAAQAIDSYYKNRPTDKYIHETISKNTYKQIPLGSIGHLSAFSFHETKNITSGGEGGMLVINDDRFCRRAEIIWEKGTNRTEFFRGEVNKYGWVDVGSSFLPSEIVAAFLWAQLEFLDVIQNRRRELWNIYNTNLISLSKSGHVILPDIPDYATNNAHIFYLICNSLEERTRLINFLKKNDILSVFHYLPLHLSKFYKAHHTDTLKLPQCERYADCLVRLPLYYQLKEEEVKRITNLIIDFYNFK